MEKLRNPYDKEYMKMAILKHEQTFKEQVYELHRLYRIQKVLMKNMEGSGYNRQNEPQMNLDLEDQPAEEYIVDESEIELTLGPTSYFQKKKIERPLPSDSGPSLSSCSTSGSIHMKRTREELSPCEWGLVHVPSSNSNLSFLCGRMKNVDVKEQLRQERLKQPPWIYHVLSL